MSAPEKIWIDTFSKNDRAPDWPTKPVWAATEYTRTDLSQAAVAAALEAAAAANARADQARNAALVEAANEVEGIEGYDNIGGEHPLVSMILALRDKPAPAVTVQKAILEVWGCCEELEDEALAKLSGVKTEHEKGFWTGQKMTAKRIRRATQMPIAGGGDE